MSKVHKSVRVDQELLVELEELARDRIVPVTFADQVEAGLRLLVEQAADAKLRRSSALVRADGERAKRAWRQLGGRGRG